MEFFTFVAILTIVDVQKLHNDFASSPHPFFEILSEFNFFNTLYTDGPQTK